MVFIVKMNLKSAASKQVEVNSQQFYVSSQQKKSAVSDFFKFSVNQVSSLQNEVRSQ